MMKFIASLFASTLLIAGTAASAAEGVRELNNAPVCETGAKFKLNPIVPWCPPEGVLGDSLQIVSWLASEVCQKWYISVNFCLEDVDSVDWYLNTGGGYELLMTKTNYPHPLPGCMLKGVLAEFGLNTVFSLKAKAIYDGVVVGEIEILNVEFKEDIPCGE
jgi:hypothetical protein